MKINEIRNKERAELMADAADLRNKLAKLRFDVSGKQTKNHREMRKAKKDIARILTLLHQGSGEKVASKTN